MNRIVLLALVASCVAGLMLNGCTSTGMTEEQRQLVRSEYKYVKRYMNAVVYSKAPIPAHWGGRISTVDTTAESAVWLSKERRLRRFAKLVYLHDQGIGYIYIQDAESRELEPTEGK